MAGELDRRLAVVLGASGTLGSHIAAALASPLTHLVLVARDGVRLGEVARGLPAGACSVRSCDLMVPSRVQELAEWTARTFGNVDVLCNCAGRSVAEPLEDTDDEVLTGLWEGNLGVVYRSIRSFLPFMSAGSAIVNVASSAGLRPVAGYVAYTTTKAAVIHLSQAAALELAPRGIRVNCVCPGVVPSPIHDHSGLGQDPSLFYEAMRQAIPLGRLGRPEDVAAAVRFLVSQDAAWVTGAVLPVDGGMSLV